MKNDENFYLVDVLKKIDYKISFQLIKNNCFKHFAKCSDVANEKSLIFLDEEPTNNHYKYLDLICKSNFKNISCIIMKPEHYDFLKENFNLCQIGIVLTEFPRFLFFAIREKCIKILPTFRTKIGRNFKKGKNVIIPKNNTIIGENVYIGDNTIINENSIIGDNVKIYSNCCIGENSFENVRKPNGESFDITSLGKTIISNNVIIHSNVIINKALFSYDKTFIGENVIIDSNVYIGHGCKIGKEVNISAGCVILGYVNIGSNSNVYANVTVRNRLVIGEKASIKMGSVVITNVGNNCCVSGNFAIDHFQNKEEWKKRLTNK